MSTKPIIWASHFSGNIKCKLLTIEGYHAKIEILARDNSVYKQGEIVDVAMSDLFDKVIHKENGYAIAIGKEFLNDWNKKGESSCPPTSSS